LEYHREKARYPLIRLTKKMAGDAKSRRQTEVDPTGRNPNESPIHTAATDHKRAKAHDERPDITDT
jgi:hypothetical protein